MTAPPVGKCEDSGGATAVDDRDTATARVVDKVRGYRLEALPASVVEVAKHCLIDWFAVALAGSREPVTRVLAEEALDQGGKRQASVVGYADRVSVGQAALINGAAAHALDYDDVLRTMFGHPSAPVAAAALAVAERRAGTGADLLAAFVAGVEAQSAIGRMVEPGHHEAGWHTTATLGTFGATAACSHLLSLERTQWLAAFGLAGTQAGGLKAVFGTMAKPFHAGRAAASGVLAAGLARRGMSSCTDILGASQGFGHAVTSTYAPDALPATFATDFDLLQVLFKRHAACYLTHSAIEGVLALSRKTALVPNQVVQITVGIHPVHLTTCGIDRPTTPLEGKFSLKFAVALALVLGRAGESDFTPETLADPGIARLSRLVRLEIVDGGYEDVMATPITLELDDGELLHECIDLGTACALDAYPAQRAVLLDKFRALAVPVLGEERSEHVADVLLHLEEVEDIRSLMALVRGPLVEHN